MSFIDTLRKEFKDPGLLDHALTHRSWINEHPGIRTSNERLEFLGDAVLEFIISFEIYKELPEKEEGYLTSLRASIVNTQNLAVIAKNLEIGQHLLLARGEDDGGGRQNPSLLANTMEAIIGALYLDQGMDKTHVLVKEILLADLNDRVSRSLKDPKSSLQEKVQAQSKPTPKYKVTSELGPDHAKIFEVEVWVENEVWGKGSGRSKNEAEQEAAKAALVVKFNQKL